MENKYLNYFVSQRNFYAGNVNGRGIFKQKTCKNGMS